MVHNYNQDSSPRSATEMIFQVVTFKSSNLQEASELQETSLFNIRLFAQPVRTL